MLGGNFAGLTAARFIRDACGDAVRMTLIDRKSYLLFIPNIPMAVFENEDPSRSLHLPLIPTLENHDIRFVQGDVREVDIHGRSVRFVPCERPGSAPERISYDYLVLALGASLAYDHIPGFAEHGHTVSDTYYGNKLRRYLFDGGYRGGPIAIGSAFFHQGSEGNPDWLPIAEAACEGPPLEVGLTLAHWLEERGLGGAEKITLFTPAEMIAEDAGEKIVDEFLAMATDMGFGYRNNTRDIAEITADGIAFANGDSVEAELKIIMPDWVPYDFLAELPITDEVGFVVTDELMRNPRHPEIFAVGDCAALTVPKLGSLGHQQGEIVGRQIGHDMGVYDPEKANRRYEPEVVCFGDMGGRKAFYIHSNTWFGGDTSIFKMGYAFYAMKVGFKEMYYRTGGKPPTWGVPLTEALGDRI